MNLFLFDFWWNGLITAPVTLVPERFSVVQCASEPEQVLLLSKLAIPFVRAIFIIPGRESLKYLPEEMELDELADRVTNVLHVAKAFTHFGVPTVILQEHERFLSVAERNTCSVIKTGREAREFWDCHREDSRFMLTRDWLAILREADRKLAEQNGLN